MKAASFFKSLGYLLFLNVLIKPLWVFGVDRQIQNVVGHEAYGSYFALLSLSLVFLFLADAGLSNLVSRQMAAGESFDARQLLLLKGGMLAVYVLVVLAVAWLSGHRYWSLLLPVVLIQALTSLYTFLRHVVAAHQLFTTDAWLSVIDKGLMLLIFLPLLYTSFFPLGVTLNLFLYGQLFCTGLVICIALFLILKNRLLQQSNAGTQKAPLLKSLLPFTLIVLLMTAHNRLDGFLLERLHPNGAYETGLYAAAYRLLDAGNMMGYLLASFLVPYLARQQAHQKVVEETVLLSRFFLLLASGIGVAFIASFAAEIQTLLYPTLPATAAPVFQWCLAVLPAYYLMHVYGSLLTATARLKPLIFILLFSFVLNFLLCLWLLPLYGAMGCCVAAFSSQYSGAVLTYIVATRKANISFGLPSLGAVVAASAGAFFLFYEGKQLTLHPAVLLLAAAVGVGLLLLVYIPFFKNYSISTH